MTITVLQLSEAMGCSVKRAAIWIQPLNDAMIRYGINTPERIAAFLAQIGHESGRLFYVKELASGEAYEGRRDLGNTEPGDGRRFKGRGLIQITGRHNYLLCGIALDLDLLNQPELLEQPTHAAMSAAWFWWNAGLNALADKGQFKTITRRINGGLNGYDDRLRLHARAMRALEIGAVEI